AILAGRGSATSNKRVASGGIRGMRTGVRVRVGVRWGTGGLLDGSAADGGRRPPFARRGTGLGAEAAGTPGAGRGRARGGCGGPGDQPGAGGVRAGHGGTGG